MTQPPPHDTGAPWAIPYPDPLDDANDPAQSQARAEKIAAQLTVVDNKITAGSIWSRFHGTNGTAILHTNSALQAFDLAVGSTVKPWNIRAGDAKFLDCAVAGTYLIVGRQRWNCGASRATGYVQLAFETNATTGPRPADNMAPQGGSVWADNVLATTGQFAAGNYVQIRLYNFSSGNATPDDCYWSFVRIGP